MKKSFGANLCVRPQSKNIFHFPLFIKKRLIFAAEIKTEKIIEYDLYQIIDY
jgi:hypothetical protein